MADINISHFRFKLTISSVSSKQLSQLFILLAFSTLWLQLYAYAFLSFHYYLGLRFCFKNTYSLRVRKPVSNCFNGGLLFLSIWLTLALD